MADETEKRRRRKRKMTREERRARSEYMKKYRESKRDAEIEQPQAEPGAVVEVAAGAETKAPAPEQQEAQKPQWTIAQAESMLKGALAGTIEALADTAQLVWLDTSKPRLGRERAQALGELWAPILAPYITEDMAKWLVIALATGGTANVFYQWAHEYKVASPKKSLHVVTPEQKTVNA